MRSHGDKFVLPPLDGADIGLGVERHISPCCEGPPPDAIISQSCIGQRRAQLLVINWIPRGICMTPTTTPVVRIFTSCYEKSSQLGLQVGIAWITIHSRCAHYFPLGFIHDSFTYSFHQRW